MWSFPIAPTADGAPPVATQVESSACERQCAAQQKALTACVDSIREAREESDAEGESANGGGEAKSGVATPACLPLAVAAWTRCCQDASEREREHEASAS